jgi:lipid-A-disaccharide synthase-like uncharacterized protein
MLSSWHKLWNATEAYLLTLGGLAFLVLVVRWALKGVTATKYSTVNRADSPIAFWFFVVLNGVLGLSLFAGGLALLLGP